MAPGVAPYLSNELAQRLDNLPISAAADDAAAAAENASVENRWCQLRDTVQSTAIAVLGRAPRQRQDWFDDNDAAISNLLADENRPHKAYVDHPTEDSKAAFYRSRRQLEERLREMQDAWTARKAEEIQGYADRNEWKNFFSAIKAVYGPSTKGTAPLLSTDVETNVDLDLPPSLQETIKAVQQLSSGKAPGSDEIPAEVYKHGGPQLMDHLTALFQEMWRQGEVPGDADPPVLYLRGPDESLRHGESGRTVEDHAEIRLSGAIQSDGASAARRYDGASHGQRCCLSLMFSAMLMDAYRDERPGIRIAYRTDGHLLNQRRMHFQSRVSTTTVHELLFADDCALNTTSEEEMQRSMDLFSAACKNFGLVINTQKMVVMHQPPPRRRKSA
nr:unnamed protein product [Spirometra erinaceieuropaei]